MDKHKARIIIYIFLVIVVIVVIIIAFLIKNHNTSSNNNGKETVFTDDKGNKTIETSQEKPKTDMVEATPEVQEKFTISNVKVKLVNGFTITSGTIKNNDSKSHDLSIQVEFTNEKNRIAGSANTILTELKSGTSQDFSIMTMGDLSKNKYSVKAEFIK